MDHDVARNYKPEVINYGSTDNSKELKLLQEQINFIKNFNAIKEVENTIKEVEKLQIKIKILECDYKCISTEHQMLKEKICKLTQKNKN